jgi:hypothetical protein
VCAGLTSEISCTFLAGCNDSMRSARAWHCCDSLLAWKYMVNQDAIEVYGSALSFAVRRQQKVEMIC